MRCSTKDTEIYCIQIYLFGREILLLLSHYKRRTTRINCNQKQFDLCLLYQHPPNPHPHTILTMHW